LGRFRTVVRVVLVGDSQLTDTSPRGTTKLGPRLRRRGHDVETLAVGGLDTRTALSCAHVAAPADWTIFCFGANDAAPWKQVPPAEFATNYEAPVRRATSRRTLVLGPGPVQESEAPGSRTNRECTRYSGIAADVARRCGAEFISLLDALGSDDLASDGVHLNDQGYDTLECLVVDAIGQPPSQSGNDASVR
jgi:lysophospholipase L1-like esterase